MTSPAAMTVTIVTSRSHSDDVAVHPVTVIRVEAVAEHLFHCIEAVDDRHVVDNLFISELDEMGDAVADGAAARALGRGEPAKHCGLVAIDKHFFGDEAA